MKNKLIKPKPYAKTMESLALKTMLYSFPACKRNKLFDLKDRWPCYKCNGRGYKKVAVSPYDYDEETCYYCRNGIISRINFEVYFDSLMDDYRKKRLDYERQKSILDASIKSFKTLKLSEEAVNLLTKYYLN